MKIEAFRPATLKEALEIKRAYGGEVTVIAGGTDLMVSMKMGTARPARLMDVTGIKELGTIEARDGDLFIGACATFSQLAESSLVAEKAAVLHMASLEIGARQIRNMATLGGNVATCGPAGDSIPALWVLDAQVVIAGSKKQRTVPVREFNPCYRTSVLGKDEIIAGFRIPPLGGSYAGAFYKVGPRKAQAISKVSLACLARVKGQKLEDVRLAAGSVAPTVVGLGKTAAFLRNKKPGPATIERARKLAMEEVTPIDDVRSTALYRKTVLGNLVARFLRQLVP
jgi:CO/xanthine dehydrogenase FAD-binding subunit